MPASWQCGRPRPPRADGPCYAAPRTGLLARPPVRRGRAPGEGVPTVLKWPRVRLKSDATRDSSTQPADGRNTSSLPRSPFGSPPAEAAHTLLPASAHRHHGASATASRSPAGGSYSRVQASPWCTAASSASSHCARPVPGGGRQAVRRPARPPGSHGRPVPRRPCFSPSLAEPPCRRYATFPASSSGNVRPARSAAVYSSEQSTRRSTASPASVPATASAASRVNGPGNTDRCRNTCCSEALRSW